jgi:ribulose-phosphate 3-epimerase
MILDLGTGYGEKSMRSLQLSASIMCADLMNLGEDLRTLEQKKFSYLHFDLMDGHFVPEVGLGVFFLEQITRSHTLPVDVHLMVTDPGRFLDPLIAAGASLISIHCEIDGDKGRLLHHIRQKGRRAGLAVKPETPLVSILPFLDMIDLVLLMAYAPGVRNQKATPGFENRIRELAQLLDAHGKDAVDIAVDGGVSEALIKRYRDSGANFFILGSSGLFVPHTSLAQQADRVQLIFNG